MFRTLFVSLLALGGVATPCSSAWAISLPADEVDRAVVCSVYGGFAPNTDPQTLPAKRVIDHTIEEAVASGRRTEKQVNDQFYDTAKLAMYDEPRAELIADWNECRDSFAPPSFKG